MALSAPNYQRGCKHLSSGERDLAALICTLEPELNEGVYAFVSVPDASLVSADVVTADVLATMREPEGVTMVVPLEVAQAAGLTPMFEACWITLRVHSALDAVGLTAAIATALTSDSISCNVIAGAYHDHLFVPVAEAERAVVCLKRLQARALEDCA